MSSLRKRKEIAKSSQTHEVAAQSRDERTSHYGCRVKCVLALFCAITCFISAAVVSYYQAPFASLPIHDLSTPPPLSGPFAANQRLTKGYKIGGLSCPESVVEDDDGYLYTGLANGRIVKLASSYDGRVGAGKVTNISTGWMHPIPPRAEQTLGHGRPAGLRLINDDLFFADANFGILSVNLKTKAVTHLVSTNAVDPRLKFPNDLCLTSDGNIIYFTDVSAKYSLSSMMYIGMEGICDGRVLQYNRKNKQIKTVVSGLCFPNGVQVSEDGKVLIVSETMRFRVRIIDVASWTTLRLVSLPMMPDNIRPTGKGTYWVAGSFLSNAISAFMERNPILRQILSGLFSHQTLSRFLDAKYNMLVEMGEGGEVLQSLHDPHGVLSLGLSQATTLHDGRLALAHYAAPYLSILEEKDVALGLTDRT